MEVPQSSLNIEHTDCRQLKLQLKMGTGIILANGQGRGGGEETAFQGPF